jgi:hypothetical protein
MRSNNINEINNNTLKINSHLDRMYPSFIGMMLRNLFF